MSKNCGVELNKIEYNKCEASKISATNDYDEIIKVLVIGDAGVGKTSIIRRYVDDVFEIALKNTIGVDFIPMYMKVKDDTNRSKVYKFQIWDCAGQERFNSIIRSYIREANVILFTFDLSDETSFEHISKWVKHIENDMTHKYVSVLVGNKCDIPDRRVNYFECNEMANQLGTEFIEVSAKCSKNLDLLFNTMAKMTHYSVVNNLIEPVQSVYKQHPYSNSKNSRQQLNVIHDRDDDVSNDSLCVSTNKCIIL